MIKRRLKRYVLPSIYLVTIMVIALGVGFIINKYNNNYSDYSFATKTVKDNTLPVINTEGPREVSKPFSDESVSISKSFYDLKDDEVTQQNSLIFYKDTYMENTGILYTSDKPFEVKSVLEGTVRDIKQDEILGNVIEIDHSENLMTIYYSVDNIEVAKGDRLTDGQVIAKSGSNKLDTEKENCLLFEVYYKGNLIDPEELYTMDINELF